MFPKTVERWRLYAREHAAAAAARYGVALDESDVLALINRETAGKGDPTAVSVHGYRGLGQIGAAALTDYNKHNPEHLVELAWLTDASRASEQIRVVAWLLAAGRDVVSGWSPPDAKSNSDLWADVRYGWGAGHVTDAIADYKAKYGKSPTFDELAAELPEAGKGADGKYDVRPWAHARDVHHMAAKDRGEAPVPPAPFPDAGAVPADGFMGCCCAARRGSGACPLGNGTKGG